MSTVVNVSTSAGTPYTWNTNLTWDSPNSGKTWDNLYGGSYTVSAQDTISFTELAKKIYTDIYKESFNFSEKNYKQMIDITKESFTTSEMYSDAVSFLRTFVEATTITEVYSDVISFVRMLLEAFSFTEKGLKQMTDVTKESFNFSEKNLKQMTDVTKESITFTEVYNDIVAWNKTFIETFGTSESNYNLVSFIRLYGESIGVDENSLNSVLKSLIDAIAFFDDRESPLTWDTTALTWDSSHATQTWDEPYAGFFVNITKFIADYIGHFNENYSRDVDFERKVMEAVSIDEDTFKNIIATQNENLSIVEFAERAVSLNKIELISVAEKMINSAAILLQEDIQIVDNYIDLIQFMLRAIESVSLAESITKQQTILKSEEVGFNETISKTFGCNNYESVSLNEKNLKQLLIPKQESVGITELSTRNTLKPFYDTFSVSENNPIKQFGKTLKENFATTDNYVDYISFILRAVENILFNEKNLKSTTRPLGESFSATDKLFKNQIVTTKQTLSISEQVKNTNKFQKLFSEVLTIADKLAKNLNITKKEGLRLMSAIIRNANAVLSDMYFSNSDLSLEDFQSLSTPIGFEEFSDFLSGDLEYQNAIIKIVLEAGITSSRPVVEEWKLNIDVPDITDRGIADIPVGGIRVNFNRTFFSPPEVMARTTSGTGTSKATPDITSIDESGFFVVLKGDNDTPIAGSISWVAQGY